ncbi:hypothetical protein [Butyrivibrio sp. VCD2006]|uniref:hypothetical protein n=1 Tax=Butyrivibrio sp. VCD2006 TaxID=1280664 RepID=UPI0004239235|nr:hypothetical protein [Butyrivibrio sp. VCD2006]
MSTIQSDHIKIANLEMSAANAKDDGSYIIIGGDRSIESKAFEEADRVISELFVTQKDALRLKLLFEETMAMLKALAVEYRAEIWFEKKGQECSLKVAANANMNAPMKRELIDISSDKSNTAAVGIMGKIGDVIENGILTYCEVMKLSQDSGSAASVNLMGIYGGLDGVEPSVMWSLSDYKDSLPEEDDEEDEEDLSDELEKSIIANLAKDVHVGVKGNKIDMTILYELES